MAFPSRMIKILSTDPIYPTSIPIMMGPSGEGSESQSLGKPSMKEGVSSPSSDSIGFAILRVWFRTVTAFSVWSTGKKSCTSLTVIPEELNAAHRARARRSAQTPIHFPYPQRFFTRVWNPGWWRSAWNLGSCVANNLWLGFRSNASSRYRRDSSRLAWAARSWANT